MSTVHTNKASHLLPPAVRTLLAVLHEAGHEGYVVGGAVRDLLRGVAPKDWDIASSAPAASAQALFAARGYRVLPTGLKHGTLTVLVDNDSPEPTLAIELTSFRADGPSINARHPTKVSPVQTIEEDLARRDFTINALALAADGTLIDPFGGRADLAAQQIHCVGTPKQRFTEDALRILRALRFASQLGFCIEPATAHALLALKEQLHKVSWERRGAEFAGIVAGANAADVLRRYAEVVCVCIPEIQPCIGFDQRSRHHVYDVWEHTLVALANQRSNSLAVRMATLLHDIGKPETFFLGANDGQGHFYGHAEASAALARSILCRLRYSRAFIDRVVLLIGSHMAQLTPSRKCVRRQLATLGEPAFYELLDLKRADIKGFAENDRSMATLIDQVEQMARGLSAAEASFSLQDLAINGRDLLELGIEEGPQLGELLHELFGAVLDERLANEREQLLVAAQGYLRSGSISSQQPSGSAIK